MANGKKPVLTGVIQSAEDPKKILGRVALWEFEGKKEGDGNPLSRKGGE